MDPYLASTDIVNWEHPDVKRLADQLGQAADNHLVVIRRCFHWVRDEVRHSSDYRLNPVTCCASEVLSHRTGFCYAKSHLLAALLRANSIPAGFCYQRLSVDGQAAPFCLHGLNAVRLPDLGWFRLDARGNRDDVHAEFTPPLEQLAFHTRLREEADLPEVWPAPLPQVVNVLRAFETYDAVLANLPDLPIFAVSERR